VNIVKGYSAITIKTKQDCRVGKETRLLVAVDCSAAGHLTTNSSDLSADRLALSNI